MTHDEIIKSLEEIKDELENILGNLPDESEEWESIEVLLAQTEATLKEVDHE